MQENSRTKKILTILAVLIILAALGRVLSYEPKSARANKPAAPKSAAASATEELLPAQPASKYEEFLGTPAAPEKSPAVAANPAVSGHSQHQPIFITEKQPYPHAKSVQTPRQPYSNSHYGGDHNRVVSTNFYTPDRGTQAAQPVAPSVAHSTQSIRPSVSMGSNASMQEERAARILAPFSRASRQAQEKRNAQWAKLSAALDRAVFQALMPKSKKEALLEKYAPQPAAVAADPVLQSSGLTGAFAPVGQALATQKQEIMKNFASSFGGNAAQQAGRLMDSFSGEVGAALHTPGLTQAQASQRVKEISKKYQDKMNELADKNQYDKFVADRLAQDNEQKDALRGLYPDGNLSAQINEYIDTASQKVQELVKRTDLSQEEQAAQYAQIEQEKRANIQKAIGASGQSLNPFYKWEQDKNQQELAELKTKIENGEVQSVARVATPRETSEMQSNFEAWEQKFEKGLLESPHFGQQAVEEVKPILEKYKTQLNTLYTTELSPDERQEQANKIIANLNREMLQNSMDQVERMDIPDEQKQQALEELRQRYNTIK